MAEKYNMLVEKVKRLKKYEKETGLYRLFGETCLLEIYAIFVIGILLLLSNVINIKDNNLITSVIILFSAIFDIITSFLLTYRTLKFLLLDNEKNIFCKSKNIMLLFLNVTTSSLIDFFYNIYFTKELVVKIIIAIAIHFILVLMYENIKSEGVYILSSILFIIIACFINKFLLLNMFAIKYLVLHILTITILPIVYNYEINKLSNYLEIFNSKKFIYMFFVCSGFRLLIIN